MKVAFCIFSYDLDKELCRIAVASIDRLKTLYPEHEIQTAIINDGNAPIPTEDMPPVEIVKTTTWARGLNLSSTENIFGQAAIYKELVEETGADVIVKMDSDTIASRLDWLKDLDGDNPVFMWGTQTAEFRSMFGHFYAIRKETALALYELLQDEAVAKRVSGITGIWIAEDRIFTRLAEMAHARGMIGRLQSEFLDYNQFRKILTDESAHTPALPRVIPKWLHLKDVMPTSRYSECVAVTFKRRGKTDDIVAEALEGMNAFWEVLKDEPRFKTPEELREQA